MQSPRIFVQPSITSVKFSRDDISFKCDERFANCWSRRGPDKVLAQGIEAAYAGLSDLINSLNACDSAKRIEIPVRKKKLASSKLMSLALSPYQLDA
jgi:hypothetical protein